MPGPGAYETLNKDKTRMHQGGRYSLGKEARMVDPSLREIMAKNVGATYDVSVKKSGPSFGFGSGKRSDPASK